MAKMFGRGRSRLVVTEDDGAAAQPLTIGRLFAFDLTSHIDLSSERLAIDRVRRYTSGPWILLASQLVAGGYGLIAHSRATGMPMSAPGSLAAALIINLMFGLLMLARQKMDLAPHTLGRIFWLYCGLVTALWSAFGVALTPPGTSPNPGFIVGLAALALVAQPVPAATLAVALITTTMLTLIGAGLVEFVTALAVATIMAVTSIITTRQSIRQGYHRLDVDHQAHKALQFVEEFEHSGHGWFWETNTVGDLTYLSPRMIEAFDRPAQEIIGRRFTDLMRRDEQENARHDRTIGFNLSTRLPFSGTVVRSALGEEIYWSLSGNPVFDHHGRFHGFRGIGTDLTEQRRSEQEITRLARFDSLTGLPNRAQMRQTLDEALRSSARRKRGCALFLIDLDRFKNVNDTLGHPIGDALLRQVGRRLSSVMGTHGQIGRLGGDEFKAVLPGMVETGFLETLARTLIDQVSQPYEIEGHRVTIGASVGIAIGDPGRGCADSLVRNADLALYAAKAAGRGQHRFYEASMHSEASERQLIENDLRLALERGEMSVVYQPIIALPDERVSGFEALLRWRHPVRGAISPAVFVPLAEECGMIHDIGRFVLHRALHAAASWPDDIRVAVNVSPIQFNDPATIDVIADALAETGVRANRLELEITESVFLGESDSTDEMFTRLKRLGVRLALDDFGTGYSSLGYLRKAPFDKIKIDQSFVRGSASVNDRNSAIVKAIVTLAQTMGMDSVAEGVETHDDLDLLRQIGVSQVQGYIFGRPCTSDQALALAVEHRVEASGYQSVRRPRHRLMRRGLIALGGRRVDIMLRNISANGALVECLSPVDPGQQVVIDIIGAGPVTGKVRWAQPGKFGLEFDQPFDLAQLAPQAAPRSPDVLRPDYIDEPAAARPA